MTSLEPSAESARERDPVEQLAEDFLDRYRRGERPALSEYAARLPEHADEIRELFPALLLMEQACPEGTDPKARFSSAVPLERLGDYRIIREVGRGGMGIVYEAEQEALNRHVALKVLPFTGVNDPKGVLRFRREARAAARLHHTNIVPVFDIGEREGVHYYAMQFIQGQALDEVIRELRGLRGRPAPAHEAASPASLLPDQSRGPDPKKDAASIAPIVVKRSDSMPASASSTLLSHSDSSSRSDPHFFRSVARIGQQAASALAYAHAQHVLHRDIKPSNLILDASGALWVTDFGLAKEEGDNLTRTGDVVGTLRYIAPERFARASDARSDIYSLGLTLYELMTLQAAFVETDRVRLIHAIGHREPEAPRKLDPRVPRDLETIVLKAITKEPAHRYGRAEELEEDLSRFLLDRPIAARRASGWERTWRWCRRNPLVASLAGALGLIIVASVVGLSGLYLNADSQRQRAESAEENWRQAAEEARQGEAKARQSEADAKAVLDFVENKVFAAARPKDQVGGLGYDVQLADAIKSALPYVETSFPQQPLIEARLRMTLGQSFLYLGKATIAIDQFQRARELYTRHRGPDHPDTLKSMNNLANSYYDLARHADALKLHEETLALRKAKLGPDHPYTLMSMNNLATSYYALGRYADALKLHEETLALDKAKLGPDHPDTLLSMHNLASSYYALGRHADALKLNEETLALKKAKLGPDHPDTLLSMDSLAFSYAAIGRPADALKLRQETLALRRVKLGPDHPDTLASMHNLAISYDALGRHADALKLNEETLALKKAKLGPDHPDTLWSMYNIACSHALMIPKSQDGAKEAELGMDWLKKAVAAGLKDAAQIAKDKDLDALRGREDFKKLLAEVQGRQEKAKK
jgi:serine/threonine protein kinase/tetratricopeptide (TPR) repeat protein